MAPFKSVALVGGAIHVLHAARMSSTRHEQEVGRAFREAGSCSVGLPETFEFVGELVVDCQGGGIPTRVRREERDAVAGWALTGSNQADVGLRTDTDISAGTLLCEGLALGVCSRIADPRA